MNKKMLAILAVLLSFACIFAVATYAAEKVTEVYITAGGTGNGLTPETPVGTIGGALSKLTADGTIYIVDTYRLYGTRAALADSKYDVTFKAYNENSVFHLDGEWYIVNSTTDNTFTIDVPMKINEGDSHRLVGGYNNIVFGENFTVTGGDFHFYGGMDQTTKKDTVTEDVEKKTLCNTSYEITVKNGTFAAFGGGNYRKSISDYVGAIAAPITINIEGGTFGKETAYDISTHNKTFDAFSISGMSFLTDNATLNISGGTFNCPIYVQGKTDTIPASVSQLSTLMIADPKYYVLDGNVKINITGGTFKGGEISAYYTHAAYTTLFRGNLDIDISGGDFKVETVIDATQVKAYEGSDNKATLTYKNVTNITPKRVDVVNGVAKEYEEPIRVAFIGDSITEGYAPDKSGVVRLTDGYPAQFLKLCEENRDEEIIVGNFGVSGAGFHPAISRYYPEMLAYPLVLGETEPTYVFFAMGTNDANTAGGTNGGYVTFQKSFENIVSTIGNLESVEGVYITNAIYRNANAAASIRATSAMHHIQKDVANKLAARDDRYHFIDLYGLTLDMAKEYTLFAYIYDEEDDDLPPIEDKDGDNLHPTHAGLAAMGKHCYNALFEGIYAPEEDYKLTEIYLSDSGTLLGDATSVDTATNSLIHANGLAAYDKEVTFYISGTLTLPESSNIFLTGAPSKLNIVGLGDDARIIVDGNTLKCGTNTKFDNVTLEATYAAAYIYGGFNSIEITESVKTVSDKFTWSFAAGYNTFTVADPATNGTSDSVESASSSKNCTITINGGTFEIFLLGNLRINNTSPFGTYSGNMNVYVGGNAVISDTAPYVGLVGHNYHTGRLVARIDNWGNRSVDEYTKSASVAAPIVYDASRNTGIVKVFMKGETYTPFGDADLDGTVSVKEALSAIDALLNGIAEGSGDAFFGEKSLSLADIMEILLSTVK